MDTALKGDSKSSDRPLQGRLDDQNPRIDRRPRQSRALQSAAGHRYDTIGVAPLIEGVEFEGLIADKAFDANWIIKEMNERGAKIVISQRPKRKQPLQIDAEIYKWRHLIENFFAKLKAFKGIAMRSEKTDRNFCAMIYACAAVINSR